MLLVAFVYQMGACPCGCLKHNYWRKLFVASARDNLISLACDSKAPATSRNDDDCIHMPRERARLEVEDVTTKRNDQLASDLLVACDALSLDAVESTVLSPVASLGDVGPPLPHSASHDYCAISQVYRL